MSNDRGRPQERTAPKMSGNDLPIVRLELVVDIDHKGDPWSTDFERFDRFAMDRLRDVASGTVVRVVVGNRTYPGASAVQMLRWVRERGATVIVLASTIEAGLYWQHAVSPVPLEDDGRAA